jgi:hypothetical protein
MNVPPELTELQRAVARWYLDVLGDAAAAVSFVRYAGPIAFGSSPACTLPYTVLHAPLRLRDGGSLGFFGSLGDSLLESQTRENHEHQFLCVCDGTPEEIVPLVAFARAHHAFAGRLDVDHTLLLYPDSALGRRGYSSALVTSLRLYPPLARHDHAHVAGVPMRFHGLLPLREAERRVKIEKGVVTLFEHFGAEGRDLLAIEGRRPEA